MKTVDPGRPGSNTDMPQNSTSRVLSGHVNPFARNLHVQCCSNLARDARKYVCTIFLTRVDFNPPPKGRVPLGGRVEINRGKISTRVKRNASCKRAIHFVHMAG